MYKLYWSPDSGAFAPHAVLEEIGAAYELLHVNLSTRDNRTPEFLKINPLGQVPVLVLPDGAVMTESAAMVLYLADCSPASDLLPPPGDPARAHAYRWLLFQAVNLYEGDLRYYYPERYAGGRVGADAVRGAAVAHMRRSLEIIEHALDSGPYLLGSRFSVADAYLLMLVGWYPEKAEIARDFPRIQRLCEATRKRPAIARIWPQHHPA